MNMDKVEEWLSGIPSEITRKGYRFGLKKFEKWLNKSIESLTNETASKTIEQYFIYLKNAHCQNTARSQTNSVVQYLKSQGLTIKLRPALNVFKTVATIRDHQLSIVEVQSMNKVGDLREQLLLKVGLFGFRVGDVSLLEWKTFDVSGELPIEIQVPCKKEDTIATTFIDSELKELLDKYIPTIDKSNNFLFQTKRKAGNLGEKQIDKILKALYKRAGLVSNKIVRWHTFRKLVLRTSVEVGVNSWSAKMMVGKAVPVDIATYISGVSLKEDYLKLTNILKLKGSNGNNGKVTKLEEVMNYLEKENSILKTRVDLLQKNSTEQQEHLEKEIQKLKDVTELLYPKQLERNILTDKGIETYTETFSTPEEYVESERKFMREGLLRGKSKEEQERLKDSVFVLDRTGKMTNEQVESEAKKLKQKGLK
jgi:site-specific recombinase XerD